MFVIAVMLVACGSHDVRLAECDRFADWSNELELEANDRVPSERIVGVDAPAARAAWYRERAAVLRELAARPVPFSDELVRGLGERRARLVRELADAHDARASAEASSASDRVLEAQRREADVLRSTNELLAEWTTQCRM